MKKTGIFYGSTTGTTERIAKAIAGKLNIPAGDVNDVNKITAEKVNEYDVLLLGSATWGYGELQDDWYDGVKVLKSANLAGKTIALFGCGDSESYCDTFCDAIGLLYEELKDTDCTFVGQLPIDGYSFSSSVAVVNGSFVGLAIDDINEDDKTDARIDAWIENIKSNL